MECPKCHSVIKEGTTICPKCHKVLALECPNCHSIGESAVCETCGYTILVKCSKCSKINPVTNEFCTKCKFPTKTALAYQECETDDFASLVIKFNALKNIRKLLKSQNLYTKFYFKLKNLLLAQIKNLDCKLIIYNDTFVVNFNKELSFPTSSNKALRLALKIANVFTDLNTKVMDELGTPLLLNMRIVKKSAEQLQELSVYENNAKPLTIKKVEKRYLKGLQITLDQYVRDEVSKDYKTDSLYSIETNGKTIVFYEVILDSYVLPPNSSTDETPVEANKIQIKKAKPDAKPKDIYSFKVFDINAKCSFVRTTANELPDLLSEQKSKIISVRAPKELAVCTDTVSKCFEKEEYRVINISCTEEMNYKPWGFLEEIFKSYFSLGVCKNTISLDDINPNYIKLFQPLFDLAQSKPSKAMTPEDARFLYMEIFGKLFGIMDKTAIVVDGFENLDDTSIQTLELYFDNFKRIKPTFVFLTDKETSVHSKIKSLLRTNLYIEFTLQETSIDKCLEDFKLDAGDFIKSFYFEKIEENFGGSYLYFKNAMKYLYETGVLLDFENRLIIKDKKSVILPKDLKGLYKSRFKLLNKNMDLSLILAYSTIFGSRLDFRTLELLGLKDVSKNAKILEERGFARIEKECLYINDFSITKEVIEMSLKKEALEFLAKNILAKLAKGLDESILAFVMGKLSLFKEEYLTLWKNSSFAINTGDYDSYLKNCLGFLSLVEHIDTTIEKEVIEENKKDVYNNILMFLYSYSPAKIYFIENILLMDAIEENNDEKIVKLSNLMLQGALISSNYTDALGLLHNILSRMPNPSLVIDGAVNSKFLLLSLVHIEILYNIGDFRTCADIAQEILEVLSPEILDKIKPQSFSINLFVSHILETLRLAGFAKLYLLDNDIDEYFDKINNSLSSDLEEKDCILAIKDYLAGKVYSIGNIEAYTPFSKVIFLILQEISELNGDYKKFAQNIYQAKLLALDIHQKEIELFCDLLIAYAYSKMDINEKAEAIYNDVLNTAEKSAIFNILLLAKYFKALSSRDEKSLLLINDSLALIQKYNNQAKILYALFEKLYIKIAEEHEISAIDVDIENQKLEELKPLLSKIITD